MKSYYLNAIIFVLFVASGTISAQEPLIFAKTIGGANNDWAMDLTLDQDGNVYNTGYFEGTANFNNPGDEYLMTAVGTGEAYVVKMNNNGTFQWAVKFTATASNFSAIGRHIDTDSFGNVYIAGTFRGSVDFDPGDSEYILTSAGVDDVFVVKLNSAGDFVWARKLGAGGYDIVYDMKVTNSGDIFTTGQFVGTIDFDPGTETHLLSAAGTEDVFVWKLDSEGDFQWARKFGIAGEYTRGLAIDVDNAGNIVVGGIFRSSVDFNPGADTFFLTAQGASDIFILKLNMAGDFLWARSIAGPLIENINGLAVDDFGDVFVTGSFSTEVDFDPPGNGAILNPVGGDDIYILKIASNSDFKWVRQIASNFNERAYAITLDDDGNVFTTGYYIGTTDFDPGSGVFELTNSWASGSIFVSKLNNDGHFISAIAIKAMQGGASQNFGSGIEVDQSGYIFLTGVFNGTVDFDPGNQEYHITSAGFRDGFVVKFADLPVSSSSVWSSDHILIYPNPANEYFMLDSPNDGVLKIYDVFGRLVLTKQIFTGTSQVFLHGLTVGTYVVNVSSSSGHYASGFVLIR